MTKDLLVTKLHRPLPPASYISRPAALEALERGGRGVLTLVSAPAGYGKSTCVAAWLASRAEPSAWLSLDSDENAPARFVTYLVAALRTVFANACARTESLLSGAEIPPAVVLARSLANELDELETPFTLVLDDYHVVDQPAVHAVLEELLIHPPRGLHLIMITRRDPPLPLAALRAAGQLTELRLSDLAFDPAKSARFLEESTGLALSRRSLDHVHEIFEGWPAGLHLVSLALRQQPDPETFLTTLSGPTHEVEAFLAQQVLADLPAELQAWLLRTSILDRFCAPLCEAVCAVDREPLGPALDGRSFVDAIDSQGLFAIALDPRNEWWRLHHVFKALLHTRLEEHCTAREIRDLHLRALHWLEENGFAEEAFRQAIDADDSENASRVLRRHRNELMSQEKWALLDGWLSRIPRSVIERDPALLAAQAWSCEYRFRSVSEEYLRLAKSALLASPADLPDRTAIQGEVDGLSALHEYYVGHTEEALACADRALSVFADEATSQKAYVLTVKGLLQQSTGDFEGALGLWHAALEEYGGDIGSRTILLLGLAVGHWLEGDLLGTQRTAQEIQRLGREHGLPASIAYGNYLLGIVHYVRDERAEAARALESMVEDRFFASQKEYYQAAFALMRLRLAQGREEDARRFVETVSTQALETGDARIIALVNACEVDVSLSLGLPVRALSLAERISPREPFRDIFLFFAPYRALVRAWLAEGSSEALGSAIGLLDRLLDAPHAAHNVPIRIEALSLRALADLAGGDEEAALAVVMQALELAAPGGFVRPFADLGQPMAALLDRLPGEAARSEQVIRIRTAFERGAEVEGSPAIARKAESHRAGTLAAPLTNREQDVLELLAKRLRDKEIATTLFVSPETVKSHLRGLYRKLGVGSRLEAVARAGELGILDHR